MTPEERALKSVFCIKSAEEFNTHTEINYRELDDEKLDYYVDFFDYLWDK